MSLDLQQLRTFVAVSREGNVAKAATALHLTASPVSRTLRELERIAGPLFDREYHNMQLTNRGRQLLPIAVGIVRASDDFAISAAGRVVPLRYATTPWIPTRFADSLRDAAESAGEAEEAEPAVSATLLHRMAHGDIDIALIHLPVDVPGVSTIPIARYQFTLAVADTDPLARRTSVARTDLTGRRVLTLPAAMQPAAMAILRDWLTTGGVTTIEEIDLADVPILSVRLRRKGVVTLNATGPDPRVTYNRDIITVPFDEDSPLFQIGIAWRTDDSLRRDRLTAVVDTLRPPEGRLITIG
jgi:DNA-binding transcriptional LysR family regulator